VCIPEGEACGRQLEGETELSLGLGNYGAATNHVALKGD